MSQFKVGQKIRCIDDGDRRFGHCGADGVNLKKGEIYTVFRERQHLSNMVIIKLDGLEFPFFDHMFELVEDAPRKYWLVAGAVYPSRKEAEESALLLAFKSGFDHYVYEAVFVAKVKQRTVNEATGINIGEIK